MNAGSDKKGLQMHAVTGMIYLTQICFLKKWINTCTLLYIKWVTNKDLLYSIGNYTQHFVIIYEGRESVREYIYIYIYIYVYD